MEKLLTIGIIASKETTFLLELLFNISSQCRNYNLLDKCEVIIAITSEENKETTNIIQRFSNQFTVLQADATSNSKSLAKNEIINISKSKYIVFINGSDNFTDLIDKVCLQLQESETKDVFLSDVQHIQSEGALSKGDYLFSSELFRMSDEQFERDNYKVILHQPQSSLVYRVKFLQDNNIYFDDITGNDIYCTKIALVPSVRYGRIRVKYYGIRINNSTSGDVIKKNIQNQLDFYKTIVALATQNHENKFAPYMLYAVWKQTHDMIYEHLSRGNSDDTRSFLAQINSIMKNNKKIIRKSIGSAGGYIKLSYKIKILFELYKEFLVIMTFRNRLNRLFKNKKTILKKPTIIFSLLPINDKKVFFSSQYGKYNDNSKYLYQTMKQDPKYADYKFIFAVNDSDLYKNNNDFINYNNKLSFYFHHYTAKKVYFNTWIDGDLKKRSKQTWIQLWHGYPYKKIYSDVETFNLNKDSSKQKSIINWDYVWSVDKKNTEVFKKLFPSVEVIEKEYPKTLWLIKNKDNLQLKSDLTSKYGLDEKIKYVLYAPTYRPYYYDFNLDDIRKFIPEDYRLIVHLHPYVNAKLLNKKENDIILTHVSDIQEVVLIVDRLITDYSSLAYDYMAIDKKVEYDCPDIELYKEVHGLYKETTPLKDSVFNQMLDTSTKAKND